MLLNYTVSNAKGPILLTAMNNCLVPQFIGSSSGCDLITQLNLRVSGKPYKAVRQITKTKPDARLMTTVRGPRPTQYDDEITNVVATSNSANSDVTG